MFLHVTGKLAKPNTITSGVSSNSTLALQVNVSANSGSLSKLVGEISRQSGLTIVAESGRQHVITFGYEGKVSDCLDRICEAFDYSWHFARPGVVFMRNRFQEADAYPRIHHNEVKRTAEDIVKLIDLMPVEREPYSHTSILRKFYSSLSSAQRSKLDNGLTMRISDLTPEQAGILKYGIVSGHFGMFARPWSELASELGNMAQGRLQIIRGGSVDNVPSVKADLSKLAFDHGWLVSTQRNHRTGHQYDLTLLQIEDEARQ